MEPMSIRAARQDAGLLQKDLAKVLKVSRKTVSLWEQGKSVPRADKIPAICKAVGRSYDEIRWGT